MKVSELKSRIEKFHQDLAEHYELWSRSLESEFPEYPIRNLESLRSQSNSLSRQLGAIRPFIEQLVPTQMGSLGGSWDAYDCAVSNDIAQRKGPSIEGILPQLQQVLGRLESLDPNDEFATKGAAQPARNLIYVERMTNSQIQQGTNLSSQSQTISPSQIHALEEWVKKVRQELPNLPLSGEDKREAESELATLEAQAKSSKPKVGIIGASLTVLRELLLHTGGALAAHELVSHMPNLLK